MTNHIDFQVVGDRKINCISCETLINVMLERASGIEEVTSSAKTQYVTVSFDDAQISAEQVRAKLNELGFSVEPISS
jgi:copper chaperone CopZ